MNSRTTKSGIDLSNLLIQRSLVMDKEDAFMEDAFMDCDTMDNAAGFGEAAEKCLSKETVLDHVSEFCLNKYFEKELFYALH